jgi:hypothetical protein
MVSVLGCFIKAMILVILPATESSPCGKITLDNGVLICFHFIEGGSPPKTCEKLCEKMSGHKISKTNFLK